MTPSKYIYIAITDDRYELPVYCTDSPKEMADFLGVVVENIYRAISRNSVFRDTIDGKHVRITRIKK